MAGASAPILILHGQATHAYLSPWLSKCMATSPIRIRPPAGERRLPDGGRPAARHADPAFGAQAIRTRAADYLAGTDPADPLVSPIFADLSGLPPLLIQAGSHEVLLDDATRLAAKAAADDVAVILDITPGVPHVFQAFAALLDEGDAALNRAARFVKDNTTAQKAAA
jgi:acetyl esterase/lipase